MKLRFEVDQAECFRRGIDCPKSIVTIEINPADIPEAERSLIADRLVGIDVAYLQYSDKGTAKVTEANAGNRAIHIKAQSPDYAGLIAAIRVNQSEIESQQQRHRNLELPKRAEAGSNTVGKPESSLEYMARVENAKDAKRRSKAK